MEIISDDSRPQRKGVVQEAKDRQELTEKINDLSKKINQSKAKGNYIVVSQAVAELIETINEELE